MQCAAAALMLVTVCMMTAAVRAVRAFELERDTRGLAIADPTFSHESRAAGHFSNIFHDVPLWYGRRSTRWHIS